LPDRPRHLVVVGLMASGKSTVGALVAARLGRPLLDNDVVLARVTGATAATLAARQGGAALHEAEAAALRSSLAHPTPAVVTAAASVGDRADLAQVLAGHDVVWLDVEPDDLAGRVPPGGDHRPPDAVALAELVAQRSRRGPRFLAVADLVVQWRGESPDELADRIIDGLGLTSVRQGPGGR
jgi:shikimate kinase